METWLASSAFRVYAAVCAVLVLKMVLLALGTATVRGLRKRFPNPEDARLFKGDVGEDDPFVVRFQRAHRNSLENELPFMVLGLLYAAVQAPTWAMQTYAYTFLAARLVHSFCYVFSLQPFRSLGWGVGVLVLVGLSVQVLLGAFS